MPFDVALILGYDALGGVVHAIQAAKAASLIPIVVLNETNVTYNEWLPEHLILRSANVNRDHRELVKEIRAMARFFAGKHMRIRAIVNNQDRMWPCYLDLRRAFPAAKGIPTDFIIKTSIKPNLRFLLRQTKYHIPYVLLPKRYVLKRRLFDFAPLQVFAEKSTGAIVKPVIGSGGLGVTYVQNNVSFEQNLLHASEQALAAQNTLYSNKISVNFLEFGKKSRWPINDFILIEHYIEGMEYSIEGLATAKGGIAHFVKQKKTKRVEEPVFRDLEYLACNTSPSQTTLSSISAILKIVEFDGFPFHIELKGSTRNGLKLIEFNPRVGGGSINDLISAIHSVNLRDLSMKTIFDQLHCKRCFTTVVVQPEKTGRVRKYRGLEKVQQQADCVFVKKIVSEGSKIDRMDREAYLVEFCVVGKSSAQAQRRANELFNWISVEIE